MNINLGRAFVELFSPENRRATLFLGLAVAFWQFLGEAAEVGWVNHLAVFLVFFANVGYGLEAMRRMHSDTATFRLPHASAIVTKLPMGLAFCLANLPHLIAFLLLCAVAGAVGPGAVRGILLCLVVGYFAAWMLAYDALALNFTKRLALSDALNLKKGFALINLAWGAYLQAALLPFLYSLPICIGLIYLDRHVHGLGRFLGNFVGQLSILWNLLALRQFLHGLQATTETKEPGFTPTR